MNEHTYRRQDRIIASGGLHGVREAAQRDKGLRFTTLLHHVNEKRLLDSFYLLKRQAAPSVDRGGPYRGSPRSDSMGERTERSRHGESDWPPLWGPQRYIRNRIGGNAR